MRLRKAESSNKKYYPMFRNTSLFDCRFTQTCQKSFFFLKMFVSLHKGFPGGSVVKNLPANAEVVGLIPGLGRSSGEKKW